MKVLKVSSQLMARIVNKEMKYIKYLANKYKK